MRGPDQDDAGEGVESHINQKAGFDRGSMAETPFLEICLVGRPL